MRIRRRAVVPVLALTAVLILSSCSSGTDPAVEAANASIDSQFLATSSLGRPSATPTVTRGGRVFFGGDSITVGLDAPTDAEDYRNLVATELGATSSYQARVGATAADMLPAISGDLSMAGATMVVIELGTNDVIKKTPQPDFAASYDLVLAAVRTAAPQAALVCLGGWAAAADTAAVDKTVALSCEDHGGQYVDLNDIYGTVANRGPAGQPFFGGTTDTFHPNKAGHVAIAAAVLGAVKVG